MAQLIGLIPSMLLSTSALLTILLMSLERRLVLFLWIRLTNKSREGLEDTYPQRLLVFGKEPRRGIWIGPEIPSLFLFLILNTRDTLANMGSSLNTEQPMTTQKQPRDERSSSLLLTRQVDTRTHWASLGGISLLEELQLEASL